MATDFVDLVRTNISSGTHTGGYAEYSQPYHEWKYNVEKIWRGWWKLYGNLTGALQVVRKRDGVFGGIVPGVRLRKPSWFGKDIKQSATIDIAEYANFLEYGRSRQPARPMFAPTTSEYEYGEMVIRINNAALALENLWK